MPQQNDPYAGPEEEIAKERARCATMADEILAMYCCDGQYSSGAAHAAEEIAKRIRSGRAPYMKAEYHPKCEELARWFLKNEFMLSEEFVFGLAEGIEDAIRDWFDAYKAAHPANGGTA